LILNTIFASAAIVKNKMKIYVFNKKDFNNISKTLTLYLWRST